ILIRLLKWARMVERLLRKNTIGKLKARSLLNYIINWRVRFTMTKRVKMLDLSEQYQEMREEMLETIDQVIGSSQFILGDNVRKLEADVASFSNVTHGIGVGNGSDAIHIALQA